MTTRIVVNVGDVACDTKRVIVGTASEGVVTSKLVGPGESAEFFITGAMRVTAREATQADVDFHDKEVAAQAPAPASEVKS